MSYIGSKPANKPVVASDLDPAVITGQTALAVAPADADEFLISDAGVLKRLDASLVGGGGITEADNWRITADTNTGTNGDVTANWERNDTSGFSKIGTGLSESSGIFSFASTGIYLINFSGQIRMEGSDTKVEYQLNITTNNSSYATAASANGGNGSSSDVVQGTISNFFIFDVTNTTNCKFKFVTGSFNSATLLRGTTTYNLTGFHTIRLGDT